MRSHEAFPFLRDSPEEQGYVGNNERGVQCTNNGGDGRNQNDILEHLLSSLLGTLLVGFLRGIRRIWKEYHLLKQIVAKRMQSLSSEGRRERHCHEEVHCHLPVQ